MDFQSRLRTYQLFVALFGSALWLAPGCGGPEDSTSDSTEIRGDDSTEDTSDVTTAAARTCRRKGKHACPAVCGDGVCAATETCDSCAADCGTCPPPPAAPVCGDGVCDSTETCDTCAADCGACPPTGPVCGDGVCDATEACDTCAADCGACAPTCSPQQAANGSGHHNAGANCLSCHSSLGTNLRWTVAGTLYDSLTGANAIAGGTIHVVDARGTAFDLITAQNGNFYTNQAVTFPLMVSGSLCPNNASMGSPVTDGSCNSCHSNGFRIHLP